jgi:hypothetical protein
MKHQSVRAGAVAAATLGLAAGATLATAGGAQAVARPAIVSSWNCKVLSGLYNGTVGGLVCTGFGTGLGWLGLGSGPLYLCFNTATLDPSDPYYTVTGTGCRAE